MQSRRHDDLSIRTSADGSTWRDALTAERATSEVILPGSDFLSLMQAPMMLVVRMNRLIRNFLLLEDVFDKGSGP